MPQRKGGGGALPRAHTGTGGAGNIYPDQHMLAAPHPGRRAERHLRRDARAERREQQQQREREREREQLEREQQLNLELEQLERDRDTSPTAATRRFTLGPGATGPAVRGGSTAAATAGREQYYAYRSPSPPACAAALAGVVRMSTPCQGRHRHHHGSADTSSSSVDKAEEEEERAGSYVHLLQKKPARAGRASRSGSRAGRDLPVPVGGMFRRHSRELDPLKDFHEGIMPEHGGSGRAGTSDAWRRPGGGGGGGGGGAASTSFVRVAVDRDRAGKRRVWCFNDLARLSDDFSEELAGGAGGRGEVEEEELEEEAEVFGSGANWKAWQKCHAEVATVVESSSALASYKQQQQGGSKEDCSCLVDSGLRHDAEVQSQTVAESPRLRRCFPRPFKRLVLARMISIPMALGRTKRIYAAPQASSPGRTTFAAPGASPITSLKSPLPGATTTSDSGGSTSSSPAGAACLTTTCTDRNSNSKQQQQPSSSKREATTTSCSARLSQGRRGGGSGGGHGHSTSTHQAARLAPAPAPSLPPELVIQQHQQQLQDLDALPVTHTGAPGPRRLRSLGSTTGGSGSGRSASVSPPPRPGAAAAAPQQQPKPHYTHDRRVARARRPVNVDSMCIPNLGALDWDGMEVVRSSGLGTGPAAGARRPRNLLRNRNALDYPATALARLATCNILGCIP